MKRVREKEIKAKKINYLLYGISTVSMMVVIVAAFMLPQMVFEMQDRYQMSNTEVQTRNSFDVSQLNVDYEQDLNTRLRNYCEMETRIVTAIDYELSEDSEVEEILETIFTEEWFAPLYYNYYGSMTDVNTTVFKELFALNVTDCKKYLIHNGNYQDGVALMMWYVDMNLEPVNTRIRLLIDTESHTVYYMKITAQEEYDVNKKEFDKKMYNMVEVINSYYDFYYNYYDADKELPFSEYDAGAGTPWRVESELNDNNCMTSFYFSYGWVGVKFLFQSEYMDGTHNEITMGLPVIGENIPEMIQD